MDSWHGKLGVRCLQILSSSIQRLYTILLVICFHVQNTTSFLIQVRGMTNVLLKILSHKLETRSALALHSCSLSSDHHEMSLNIDMNFILPWNCSGSPILFMNFWASWTSCNVVNPGKIFHSNSIGSPSIVAKVLYCDESLNHPDCRSQTVFGVGF